MSHGDAFPGFPPGSRATTVPSVFFSDVLPGIEDQAELTVTLYAFFALGRKAAGARWLTVEELSLELPLRRALARLPGGADAALRRGLAAALERGTLRRTGTRLALNVRGARPVQQSGTDACPEQAGPAAPEPLPTIYALYEENIGTLTPLLADELRAAEADYPAAWIREAFREAVSLNRRNWRYIARILERWREEGRNDAAVGGTTERRPDLAGRYRGLIQR